MKVITLMLLSFFLFLFAQQDYEALAERIKKVGEDLLEGYTQPLITAFGTGISTGLFHSARSHKLLGFDIGFRGMLIQIPDFARYFDARVLTCSLANNRLTYDSLTLDSVSTIFGPGTRTYVPVTGSAVGIPPYIPGGFNLLVVPLVVPQINIGLVMGSELLIRYIPFTFKGSRVEFLGLGFKQHLNSLPFMKTVPVPFDVAIGGAFQDFGIEDSTGYNIVASKTWNLQIVLSKNLSAFEPMFGFGLEGTKVHFTYEFEFEIPDTTQTGGRIKVKKDVNVEIIAQNNYRAIAGFTLKMGIFFLHYDYNFLSYYKTHNLGLGFSIR
ncbi:MAG: hypothetical protein N3A65_04915 [candidate division WOR-3 bacterium]|nr:hypothetical protein [candidate division WOR-3 bacterium]